MDPKLTARIDGPVLIYEIRVLGATDAELDSISKAMGLGLDVEEMKGITEYFREEGRNPTDVELNSLAQAWSEHCCYKSSKNILREFVFSIDHPDVMSRGDAGVMAFDDDHAYALRIESHNHPSALDPYGGAGTGIGGIIRDVVCMGATPIAGVDPLCFGPPDWDGPMAKGTKHPRYLLDGAVGGLRDYSNRVGAPIVCGGFFFDERYVENCLANVGCVGFLEKGRLLNNFAGGPGEVFVLIGSPTGRDGVHGVTFASADLSEMSDDDAGGSVQLGNPTLKEPIIHACLEINEMGLLTGMKDLGGGGLSCVIGEMAYGAGCGADFDLDKVPVKGPGLAPWEIWISETQERMMATCKPENVDKVLAICEMWDVPATVVGRTTAEPRTRLFWEGVKIFDVDTRFLTGGPAYNRPYVIPDVSTKADEEFPELPGHGEVILALLSDYNVASKEWACSQYDSGAGGRRVLGAFVGPVGGQGPGDAAVLTPVPGSHRGLAIALGCNPWHTDANPYHGGMGAVDETCRNLVAVGAKPHAITDCLNFGNPQKPDRLGVFREAVRGLGEVCAALNLPIPSGNVSLYNETAGCAVLPTPMVLGTGIIEDAREAVSADIKGESNLLYVVGDTLDEMGASLLFRRFGGRGGDVPGVDPKNLKDLTERMLDAIGAGLVLSAHDCSDGGLAVAVAEMCISGGIGAELDLSHIDLEMPRKLYSESNTRWVVEVEREDAAAFRELMSGRAVPIGETGGDSLRIPAAYVNLGVEEMREAWSRPLAEAMGGGL
ncbi:MAG: phosphoribosylformylglycinamidine synthase subunit PurL [Thermoplasmatales archaeon]|nr:phosphoribosylformylglycinamidine synthase subunit PurL [Thermoplasmatales archaeon]